jgi:hypothetical protein
MMFPKKDAASFDRGAPATPSTWSFPRTKLSLARIWIIGDVLSAASLLVDTYQFAPCRRQSNLWRLRPKWLCRGCGAARTAAGKERLYLESRSLKIPNASCHSKMDTQENL